MADLADWDAPHGPSYDPVLCALACEALSLGGGADHPRGQDAHQLVVAALRGWFLSEIPDLLESSDEQALNQQARLLLGSEGTPLGDHAQAVANAFPPGVPGRPELYEDRRSEGYLLAGPPLSVAEAAARMAEAFRGMRLYSAAFGRLAERHGVHSIPVYRGYGRTPPPFSHNAVAHVAWTVPGAVGGGAMITAEVDPRCVVGITQYRECHPLIVPFRLDTGPAGDVVQWRDLA